ANIDLPTSCESKTNIARYSVNRIFDGDTIHFSNCWKVRVIGINTPETAHDKRPAQPFADDAKTLLENLIQRSNSVIGFIPGKQEKDHYGRRLGHIFTSDEDNLAARLLEQGLGFRLSISPNLNFQDCYKQMEAKARSQRAGLWGINNSLIIDASQIKPRVTGFRLVRGIITSTNESRHNMWLNLGGKLVLQIRKSNLHWFDTWRPDELTGKHVEVRGWITNKRNQMKMHISHPAFRFWSNTCRDTLSPRSLLSCY
ncbi:MAG: hypothetical protein EP297_10175, partial [Gammaproteobacteria bacterium]